MKITEVLLEIKDTDFCLQLDYSIDALMAKLDEARNTPGFSNCRVDLEVEDGYEGDRTAILVVKGERDETSEEERHRVAGEVARTTIKERQERAEYERLRKKFAAAS